MQSQLAYSLPEAAAAARISRSTIYRVIDSGQLRAVKRGHRTLVLAEDLKRSIGLTRAASLQRGLARIDAPQGMIVAYATQAGRTAADGVSRNSPYTAAFLKHVETQDEIGAIFRHISADVYETTKHAQLPELSLSLIGEFYLNGKTPATRIADGGTVMTPAPNEVAQAWAVTQNSTSVVETVRFKPSRSSSAVASAT